MRQWRPRQLWWLLPLLPLAAVNVMWLTDRSGACYDAAEGSGATSYCVLGPPMGYEGAWAIAAISVVVAGYFVYRAVRQNLVSADTGW